MSNRIDQIGTSSHLFWLSDVHGVVHNDAKLNDHSNHSGVGRAKSSDIEQVIGKGKCKAGAMSKLFGSLRFTSCQDKGHPQHSDTSSGAHDYPKDYKAKVRKCILNH